MTILNKSKQSGFTLIELIIVIILLGILAATAIPDFSGLKDKAIAAVALHSDASVQQQLHTYHAKNDSYPTVTQLSAEMKNTTAAATGVQVSIGGTNHITLTFKDEDCTVGQETATTADVVECVQNPSPL